MGKKLVIRKCPVDGSILVSRQDRKTGEFWLVCMHCSHKETYPVDIALRDAGAPMLPGFEDY